MAQFFGYRGLLGCSGFNQDIILEDKTEITLEILSTALINNPLEEGQLGFVLDATKCVFNQEAIDILKKVKRSDDAIGDIDIFMSTEYPAVISWLGGPLRVINPEVHEGSRDYDASLLDGKVIIKDIEIPEAFKAFVDQQLDGSDVQVMD